VGDLLGSGEREGEMEVNGVSLVVLSSQGRMLELGIGGSDKYK
jgi:hypothetical protein